ncbi:phenylalanine--tRNA ligase beta subunit [Marinobacterium zhoushanense]|uniref:Phenylalanine--tRNA ligase beta subunit n=1 Tax=Marinobacterium zhoushanense TaxID=1679163 RepID=A0ABQ1JYV2_9GAMM|nr:phenylalanine--tRNA ligase subunit beta [Marinobacterium zhoushanense]GGB82270.1 phenylalanine--tRNA ligase beta subunit [Marinobacterium zhoushanense]
MKFSEHWLRELVQPEIDTQTLADQLSLSGLEVDDVEPVAGAFSGVVVGEILSAEQHPDADKLRVCQVSDGKETFQVVCGAPNARAGIKVPFAQVGAVLPGDFKIKKAKLRQVESFGMLCAEDELGLSDDHGGLMELAADAPVGSDIRDYLKLNDQIIDVDLTPNRGDCLSVAGMAREVGVLNKVPVADIDCSPVAPQIDDQIEATLVAPQGCPRYLARVIRNINPGVESPLWLQEKLRRSGIRSIDPVVDVTNYVLIELGQPMHAFDLNKLNGGIQVRMAQQDEALTLLDGQEVKLNSDTLVIADSGAAVAMAGIMGGEPTSVTDETRDILLESAFFAPLAIAGRARSYGLHTDSSHRFERGVDWQLQRRAMERATALLLEIVGGQPGPVTEAVAEDQLPKAEKVRLRHDKVTSMLALEIPAAEIEEILTRLGLSLERNGEREWLASVPSYRFDISLEMDLIEEIARVYGYNNLPVRTPRAELPIPPIAEAKVNQSRVRAHLISLGYQEAITYSFIEAGLSKQFDDQHQPMALANPISTEMAVMRTTLWPGLAKAVQYNQHRQQSRVRLFEIGQRFVPGTDGLQQQNVVAGIICGSRQPEGWSAANDKVDFFDLKGDLETLLALGSNAGRFSFRADSHVALHPGQSAAILLDGELVGRIGALHPSLQKSLDLTGPVYLFEIALDAVVDGRVARFSELSKFPESRRDLAILVSAETPFAQLREVASENAGEYLKQVTLFDVYQGQGIEPGRKSLALGLTWQHPSRTLNDEEINSAVSAVVTALNEKLGATLRD